MLVDEYDEYDVNVSWCIRIFVSLLFLSLMVLWRIFEPQCSGLLDVHRRFDTSKCSYLPLSIAQTVRLYRCQDQRCQRIGDAGEHPLPAPIFPPAPTYDPYSIKASYIKDPEPYYPPYKVYFHDNLSPFRFSEIVKKFACLFPLWHYVSRLRNTYRFYWSFWTEVASAPVCFPHYMGPPK